MRFPWLLGRAAALSVLFVLLGCGDSTGPDDDGIDIDSFAGCDQVAIIEVGSTVQGSLSTTDCLFAGEGSERIDYWAFRITSSRAVTITMRSTEIDAYLGLFRSDATFLEQDDDSGGGENETDARITVNLPAGVYVIAATSFDVDELGAYSLTLD